MSCRGGVSMLLIVHVLSRRDRYPSACASPRMVSCIRCACATSPSLRPHMKNIIKLQNITTAIMARMLCIAKKSAPPQYNTVKRFLIYRLSVPCFDDPDHF